MHNNETTYVAPQCYVEMVELEAAILEGSINPVSEDWKEGLSDWF